MIITSNRTREVHDALKRRCYYSWVDYPDKQTELDILKQRVPHTKPTLQTELINFVQHLREKDLYKLPETKEIKISESNIDLYNYAQDIGLNYKILKQYNPWLRSDKITNKKNNTYILHIPVRSEKIIFN